MNPHELWSREDLDEHFGPDPLHADAPTRTELDAMIDQFEAECDRDVVEDELFDDAVAAAWGAFDSLLEEEEDSPRGWTSLSDTQIKAAVREIVRTSTTDEEIKRRVADELGYPYGLAVASHTPSDVVGYQARALVLALDGLVTSSGAMCMIMMHGPRGNTISV